MSLLVYNPRNKHLHFRIRVMCATFCFADFFASVFLTFHLYKPESLSVCVGISLLWFLQAEITRFCLLAFSNWQTKPLLFMARRETAPIK